MCIANMNQLEFEHSESSGANVDMYLRHPKGWGSLRIYLPTPGLLLAAGCSDTNSLALSTCHMSKGGSGARKKALDNEIQVLTVEQRQGALKR